MSAGHYRVEAWWTRRLLVAQEIEHPGSSLLLAGSGVTASGAVRHEGLSLGATITASSLTEGWEQRAILQVSTPEGLLH